MSFQLASDLKTKQILWVCNGKIYDPIQVCNYFSQKYASDVKNLTF